MRPSVVVFQDSPTRHWTTAPLTGDNQLVIVVVGASARRCVLVVGPSLRVGLLHLHSASVHRLRSRSHAIAYSAIEFQGLVQTLLSREGYETKATGLASITIIDELRVNDARDGAYLRIRNLTALLEEVVELIFGAGERQT